MIRKERSSILLMYGFIATMVLLLSILFVGAYFQNYTKLNSPKPVCEACNVVIVVIDTLRADHLPCYGYSRNTAPNICNFAKEGILFERAYAPAPHTRPSIISLFTSLYVHQHNHFKNNDYLQDQHTTMAEIFSSAGYNTYGFSANPTISSKFNHDQGFRDWNETQGNAWKVNKEVFPIIENYKEPFLSYIHYIDPHDPYSPPATAPNFFARGYKENLSHVGHPFNITYFREDPDRLSHLIGLYDNEIRYVDFYVGKLFNKLKEQGIYNESIIILMSDHGEMFLEHGLMRHINGVYDELIHIPLIVKIPGYMENTSVSTPVQLIDILPTLLDSVGIPFENPKYRSGFYSRTTIPAIIDMFDSEVEYSFSGDSILFMLDKKARPIISENLHFGSPNRQQGAIIDDYKIIKNLTDNSFILFNLKRDPNEQNNKYDSDPKAQELSVLLDSILKGTFKPDFKEKNVELDEETYSKLKALGYI